MKHCHISCRPRRYLTHGQVPTDHMNPTLMWHEVALAAIAKDSAIEPHPGAGFRSARSAALLSLRQFALNRRYCCLHQSDE